MWPVPARQTAQTRELLPEDGFDFDFRAVTFLGCFESSRVEVPAGNLNDCARTEAE